ncbi:hypothetical protein MMPV_005171 [Pyropia vietnamensis]
MAPLELMGFLAPVAGPSSLASPAARRNAQRLRVGPPTSTRRPAAASAAADRCHGVLARRYGPTMTVGAPGGADLTRPLQGAPVVPADAATAASPTPAVTADAFASAAVSVVTAAPLLSAVAPPPTSAPVAADPLAPGRGNNDLGSSVERVRGLLVGFLWRAAMAVWRSGALPRLAVFPLLVLFTLKAAPAFAASTLLSAVTGGGGGTAAGAVGAASSVASVGAPGGLYGGLSAALAGVDPAGFSSGFYSSFVLILASEIGDKTFFISALLSMKYSRTLVLVGTMLALGSMTAISVGLGQVFHALPASLNSSIPFDDYAAVALLLWFGYTNVRDALRMGKEDEEGGELADAEEVVADAQKRKATASRPFNLGALRVVLETCSLVFVAEWGDKSMLATVALAAAKNPMGVVAGGIVGHFVASIIAVIGGSLLGKYISEKNARLVGGILFFVFAALTLFGVY